MSENISFPTTLLNWSWWYYHVFYHVLYNVFCWGNSMRHKWHAKNSLPAKYCNGRVMGRLLQPLQCCRFDRGTKIILREFSNRKELEWEIYLYDMFFYCFIGNNTHISLYVVFNSKWMINKGSKKRKGNTKCFVHYRGLDALYKCFLYFIFIVY